MNNRFDPSDTGLDLFSEFVILDDTESSKEEMESDTESNEESAIGKESSDYVLPWYLYRFLNLTGESESKEKQQEEII